MTRQNGVDSESCGKVEKFQFFFLGENERFTMQPETEDWKQRRK